MELSQDKQKVYTIDAEYYREYMSQTTQSTLSSTLDSVIKLLLITLFMILAYFAYRVVNEHSINLVPKNRLMAVEKVSEKPYVEELSLVKSVEPISKKINREEIVELVKQELKKNRQKVVDLAKSQKDIKTSEALTDEYLAKMISALKNH